jgi:Holliday junction resolvase RusA-like endonuclease
MPDAPARLTGFVRALTGRCATWTCWVPGEPKAMQTGTVVRAGGRLVPIRRHTEWGNRVALAAQQSRPPALFEGPLIVVLEFHRQRPVSAKKSVTQPITRPDLGNLSKGLLDALQGIVYRDDAQIVELLERKRFAGSTGPGVAITVRAHQEG